MSVPLKPRLLAILLLLPALRALAEPPHPASRPALPASAPASRPADDLGEIERALGEDRGLTESKREQAQQQSAPPGLTGALQSFNPDLTLIADVALAAFSVENPLQAGVHDPRQTGFNLQQLELTFGGAVDPYFRFDATIVISSEEVEVEEVFATSLALPWNLQVRAGQFLTRFGRLNATHPHGWAFLDQALLLGKLFGGESSRALGLELSVLLPLPWYVEVLATAANAGGEETARSFLAGSEVSVDGLEDFLYFLGLRQFFPLSDDLSLLLGLSAAFGPNALGAGQRTEIYGADLYLKYRPIRRATSLLLWLEAEWMLRRRQESAVDSEPRLLADHGVHALLGCRFARRWSAAARYEYVSGVARDPSDPSWDGLRQRLSASLTFFPSELSRLRLQYSHDRPAWREAYHAVMLGFEFAIGPHGAHTF